MMIENLWLGSVVDVGTAEAAGVSQLQSDKRPVIAAGCHAIGFEQCGAQVCQTRMGVRCNHELMRISSAFMRNGNGFAAPNQARAARPESAPAADRVFTRVAILERVPTLHWLHGDAVGEVESAAGEREV